jgi:hypothetical protein
MHSTRFSHFAIAAVAVALLASAGPADAQSAPTPLPARFSAVAVNVSTVGNSGATPVTIRINRWTSDEDRDKLLAVFREKGEKALLSALQDQKPVGNISSPGTLSYDLRYARELPGADGGHRIVLATDRPISFWEATNQPRTTDYPFLLIEMRLDKNGEGQGKLSLATKLTISDDVLVIENYANQPVMLNNIKREK